VLCAIACDAQQVARGILACLHKRLCLDTRVLKLWPCLTTHIIPNECLLPWCAQVNIQIEPTRDPVPLPKPLTIFAAVLVQHPDG